MKVDDEHLLDYLEGLYSRQDQIEQQWQVWRRTMRLIVLGKFSRDDPKLRLPVGNFIFRAGTKEVSAGMGRDSDAVIISEMMDRNIYTVTPAGTSVNLEADLIFFLKPRQKSWQSKLRLARGIREHREELDAVSQDAIERLKKYRLDTEVADKIKSGGCRSTSD